MPTQKLQKSVEKIIDKGKYWDNAGNQTKTIAIDGEYRVQTNGFLTRLIFVIHTITALTPAVYRLLIDGSPLIENISMYSSGQIVLDYMNDEFPVNKGSTLKLEQVSTTEANDVAHLIIKIKNAQIERKYLSSEELVKE